MSSAPPHEHRSRCPLRHVPLGVKSAGSQASLWQIVYLSSPRGVSPGASNVVLVRGVCNIRRIVSGSRLALTTNGMVASSHCIVGPIFHPGGEGQLLKPDFPQ